jgi:hypothetical protein
MSERNSETASTFFHEEGVNQQRDRQMRDDQILPDKNIFLS